MPDPNETATCRTEKTSLYGGQAIIEGVMMKGPERTVAACRTPDGDIVHKVLREGADERKRNFWYKTPFLRGFLILIDSMSVGYQSLMFSGEIADPDGEPRNPLLENLMVVLSLIIAISLFKFLPILGTTFILGYNLKELDEITVGSSIAFSAIEGVIKAAIMVGYILSIRLLKDVRRVFMYHGSEHKTINAYEGGVEMVVDQVKKYPTFHPRCGTSFLFAVILFSLIFAMCFPLITLWLADDPSLAIPGRDGFFSMNLVWRFLLHIIFLPVISSFGYEFIRLTAGFRPGSVFMKVLTYPGKLLQKITALEPEDEMLEVSLVSMKLAMGEPLPEGTSVEYDTWRSREKPTPDPAPDTESAAG